MIKQILIAPILIMAMGACATESGGTAAQAIQERPKLDVPYVPTPQPVVDEMLRMANVQKDEMVYDLGCGDGRIVITAAQKHGAKGIGVDIDPERIQESNQNAQAAGVTDKVKFIQQDLFKMDFKDADVLMLYLLPDINLKLRPKILNELQPGTRVVSHAFDMGDWEPDQTASPENRRVFMWVVPAKVAGTWTWTEDESTKDLVLNQEYQKIRGELGATAITDAKLRGAEIEFSVAGPAGEVTTYKGKVVRPGEIEGTRTQGSQTSEWKATMKAS